MLSDLILIAVAVLPLVAMNKPPRQARLEKDRRVG
jgi:hypothetical protein